MSDLWPQGEKKHPAGGTAMDKVLAEIIDVIRYCFKNTPYSECYVGITSDIQGRLFGGRKVSRLQDRWIAVPAASHTVAREAERFFLDAGMDGTSGSGGETATVVYAYRKTRFTQP
jgi:hypothetical protein